jgi:hypothetical protein
MRPAQKAGFLQLRQVSADSRDRHLKPFCQATDFHEWLIAQKR